MIMFFISIKSSLNFFENMGLMSCMELPKIYPFGGKQKVLEGVSYLNNDFILIIFNLRSKRSTYMRAKKKAKK
jgi:hypothetical protein